MDQSSIVSSFYEPLEVYDEAKTKALYESIKKNFQELHETLKSVDEGMTHLNKQSQLTVTLIEKIKEKPAEEQAEESTQN